MTRARSTFGAAADLNSNTNAPQAPQKPARVEVGAIWENSARSSGDTFLKVQMKIPKEMVQEALSKATGDVVEFGFISFNNKHQNGDPSRPKYRIYEDKKK